MPALSNVNDGTPLVMKQQPPISRVVTPLDKSEEISRKNQHPSFLALCAMRRKCNCPSF
jgi:hypothetical protein